MKTLLALLTVLLFACNPCKYVANHPECFQADTIRETEIQTVHDSVTWIMGDTTLFEAIFECDSLNNVLMRSLNEYKSKGVQTKIVFRDNRLQLSSFTDSIAVLNRIISNHKTHSEYIINPVDEKLRNENVKMERKLHNRRWLWWYLIASGIAIIAFLYFKIFR